MASTDLNVCPRASGDDSSESARHMHRMDVGVQHGVQPEPRSPKGSRRRLKVRRTLDELTLLSGRAVLTSFIYSALAQYRYL